MPATSQSSDQTHSIAGARYAYIIIAILTTFLVGCLFYALRKRKLLEEAMREERRNRSRRRAGSSSSNSSSRRGKTDRIDPNQRPKIHDIFVRESLETSQWRSILPISIEKIPASYMHHSASPTRSSPTAATVSDAPSSLHSPAIAHPPSARLKLERASSDSSNAPESLVNSLHVSSQTLDHDQAAAGNVLHEAGLELPPVRRPGSSGLRLSVLIQMPFPSVPRDRTIHNTSSGSDSDHGRQRVNHGLREIALGVVEIPRVVDDRSSTRSTLGLQASQPQFQPVTATGTAMSISAPVSTPMTIHATAS